MLLIFPTSSLERQNVERKKEENVMKEHIINYMKEEVKQKSDVEKAIGFGKILNKIGSKGKREKKKKKERKLASFAGGFWEN